MLELLKSYIHKEDTKVLIVSDVHLKCVNPKNRKNYPDEIIGYLRNLVKLVELEQIDVVIFLGDIYHDEFEGKFSAKYNQKLIGMVNNLKLKGVRVFTLMGNHELHSFIKGCPFFDNIEYHSNRILTDLEAKRVAMPEYPVPTWETCDKLIINDSICFEMHHFSDIDKEYLTEPNNYKTTIGLFHDAILPSKARKQIKAITEVDLSRYTGVTYNDEMFANLDYAVCGDIHTRIGEAVVETSTGEVNVDIPGSIGRVASGIAESHESVELPLFIIKGDTVTKQHITFKLLPIKDSFKLSLVEENKKKYGDMKVLTSNMESVTVRKTFEEDVKTFPNYAQEIVYEIKQSGMYVSKAKNQIDEFVKKQQTL